MTDLLDVVRRMGLDAGGTAPAVAILLRVTVLLLAAMLVAVGLRRASAALRHLVWTLSLVGTLLIPLCYWTFPAWQWAILPQRPASSAPVIAPVTKDAMPEAPPQFASSPRPSGAPAVEPFEAPVRRPATVAEHSAAPLAHCATWSWPAFFAVLWAVGTSLGLLWLGIGMAGAWHVARRAEAAADSHWRQLLQQLVAACGFRRPVAVRECPQVSVPMTWGLRRPVILVPAGSAAWSEETKRSVLLHELGHIRRGDCLMHLLGRLACVAYWFHPLVWLAARQLRKASEQAADDVVLSSNVAPPEYAQHLVGIAGQMRGLHLFGHVALPMASPSDLEGRVQAILDPRRNHRSLKRKTCYALMLVAALLLIPCALLRLGYAEEKKPREAAKATLPTTDAKAAVGKPAEPSGSAEKAAVRTPVDISGQVVDDATGEPVSNFDVQGGSVDEKDPAKISWNQYYWKDDRAGTDRFSERIDSSSRNWPLRIVAGGYVPQPFLTERPKPGVTKVEGLVIRMKRGRRVSGHVFDYAGKPVKGAAVFVVGSSSCTHPNLTGGKAMIDDPDRGPVEDKRPVRCATDADGAFSVTGIGGDADHLAVTSSALDLWIVPVPMGEGASDKLEIRLPQPGRLVVHYDIAGAPEKSEIFMQFFMQLPTIEMPGWDSVDNMHCDPIQQHIEFVLDNLTPGSYDIARWKDLRIRNSYNRTSLDQRTVKIESGKTTVVDFVRPKGAPITGQVIGLDQDEIAKENPYRVYVSIFPAQGDQWWLPTFDEVAMEPGDKPMDGRFTTERIPPGRYKVQAEVLTQEADKRNTSISPTSPEFVGEVLVTVPEEGLPEPVKIPLSRNGVPKQPQADPSQPASSADKPTETHKAEGSATSDVITAADWKPGQTLDLRVINARTKEPLPDVKLDLQCHGPGINFQDIKTYTTDAEGRSEIKLPDRRPDAVRVYPSKAGFVPLRVYWGDDLPSPKLPKSVTVPMEPGTVWGGIVQNEKGEPIANVKVTVNYWETSSTPNPHLRVNISDHEVSTDKDGRWRMDVLPATFPDDGPRLFLSHPDYVSDHLQRGYTPMPVTKRPSYESLQNQTAVMVMRKGGVIEGRVTDETRRPIAGVRIYTEEYYWFNSRKPAAITGEDGRFRIANVSFSESLGNDPPPSTLRAWERHEVALVAQAAGYTPELIHTDPNGSASPLEISLKPGQTVDGRVVDESGKPIAGVDVSISNWLGYRSRLNLTTKTDADGKFQVTDAPLGKALYDFRKKGHMAVQDFAMSPQPSGQPEKEGYQITLKSPLRVAGSIVDAETKQPLAACTAIKGIDYDDGRAPEWQRFDVKTITDGRYEFEFASNIFCSRIRVEANGYMPAVSRIFRPGDSDKGQVTYDFQLSKAAPMAGTVLGPDGKPLANAEVFLATNPFAVSDGRPSSESLRNARTARTDAAGRFELPPEVEPFYLVVLDNHGYAVINEKQFAESADIHIQPWTPENRNFRADRRPSSGARERPAADAKPALTVRVVDEEGKPVEGAHVTTYTDFHANPKEFVPYESGWSYYPNILSDSDGMARIADNNGLNRLVANCLVARHVEKKLVAIQSISPEQAKQTTPLTLTLHPQCVVSGKLTAKELEARNHKLAWSNVYVYLGEGYARPMSCSSDKADYHFYLPPGTFTLDAYATDTQQVRKTITITPGQDKLEVEPIDLPPTGLVLLEGKPAPELRDIMAWKNGGPVKLSDLRGKAVILAFTSGWDGRGSIMPGLFPLYDKYRDEGLAIIEIRLDFGLASDTEAQLEEKLAEVKKPFWKDDDGPIRRAAVQPPSLKDREAPIPIAFVRMNRVPPGPDAKAKSPCAVVEDYGIHGFPTGVLIDRQGRVVGRFDPRTEREEAALDPVLEKVLKEK